MKTILLISMVSIVLEGIVEYAKTIMRMFEEGDYKTAITQCVTVALGILFAVFFHLHLFTGAMSEFYEGLTIDGTVDTILTGILMSRGSNYVSDLISRLTGHKEPPQYGEGDDEETEDIEILEDGEIYG